MVEGQDGAGLAIQAPLEGVGLGPQFDAGHVFQADQRAVRISPEDDLFKLLRTLQPALGSDGVGVFLAFGGRLRPHLARGVDGVLLLDSVDNLRDGDIELGQLVRLDPEAHGILAGPEDGDTGDAGHPGHLVV